MKKDVYYCDSCGKVIQDSELKKRCVSQIISRGETYHKLAAKCKEGYIEVAYSRDFCLECLSGAFRNLAESIDNERKRINDNQ